MNSPRTALCFDSKGRGRIIRPLFTNRPNPESPRISYKYKEENFVDARGVARSASYDKHDWVKPRTTKN